MTEEATTTTEDAGVLRRVPGSLSDSIISEYVRWLAYRRGAALIHSYSPTIALAVATTALAVVYIIKSNHDLAYFSNDKSKQHAPHRMRLAVYHAAILQVLLLFASAIFAYVSSSITELLVQQSAGPAILGILEIPLELIMIAVFTTIVGAPNGPPHSQPQSQSHY
jgi:O-antigen/teichoic acid export membrane protein